MKFAVTEMSPFSGTVSTHVIPLHDPLNPVKVDPLLALGISDSVEPTGKIARQIPPLTPLAILQARPPGELDTEPLPVPAPEATVTEPGTARRYNACTVRDCVSATVQVVALPEQAPSQYTNTLPVLGVCMTVTLVLSAYAFTQVPLVAMYVRVHAMPSGVLVMVPPPSDPDTALVVSVGGAANCAVTAVMAPVTIVTEQVEPLHAPV